MHFNISFSFLYYLLGIVMLDRLIMIKYHSPNFSINDLFNIWKPIFSFKRHSDSMFVSSYYTIKFLQSGEQKIQFFIFIFCIFENLVFIVRWKRTTV